MQKTRIRPFSNGTEYQDWKTWNCDRCIKNFDWKGFYDGTVTSWKNPKCKAEELLGSAYIGDGTISERTYKFIGLDKGWDCPHRNLIQQTPEGK